MIALPLLMPQLRLPLLLVLLLLTLLPPQLHLYR